MSVLSPSCEFDFLAAHACSKDISAHAPNWILQGGEKSSRSPERMHIPIGIIAIKVLPGFLKRLPEIMIGVSIVATQSNTRKQPTDILWTTWLYNRCPFGSFPE
ncbi:hypothetical protein [Ruegeria lacuscaerulensis]|uniref:hypothetical protein n=1 Tax=Ruegeria lacuscaerulensis TaxID=55218 RepID=UPI00147B206C|nr:hypothetical protein [Ruegeria lacuscaerulensis]